MKQRDIADLVLLAAIWGGSFLFMRVSAPEFGPTALAFLRVAGAAVVLLPLLFMRGGAAPLLQRAGPLLLLGLTNSALPFLLFGYALLTLPSGLAAIFNAATPMATAVIAWIWLRDPLTRWRVLGLGIGFSGVAGLAVYKSLQGSGLAVELNADNALAIAACLLATLLYGFSASLVRRHLQGVPAMTMACGTQLGAALLLLVPTAFTWPAVMPSATAWWSVAALAVLASGVAYILYFRLIANVGSTQAASVTFLVPVFASVWGAMLLDEPVTLPMLIGGAVILVGTALVLGLWPRPPAQPPPQRPPQPTPEPQPAKL